MVVNREVDAAPVAAADDGAPAEPDATALAEAQLRLGDFYFKEGRYDDAVEAYLKALSYAPDDGSIHFVLADALFAQGDYHYAAFMISRGLELDPSLAEVDTDKRSFYGDPADFDRQMEVLAAYLKDKPYNAAAQLVMGYNLKLSGRTAAAVKSFERVLEIDPGHRAARALLEGVLSAEGKATGEAGKAKPEAAKPEPTKK